MRKEVLENWYVYHIFNRSIANYHVFNNKTEYSRMLETLVYYRFDQPVVKFSKRFRSGENGEFEKNNQVGVGNKLVDIVAYCIMPNHFHLILRQLEENGISKFMGNVQNSYTHYFNLRHKRKGPLWEGRFRNVLVKSDEQLLHLTRYVHLNPVTAYLCNKPEVWLESSYGEYIDNISKNEQVCNFADLLKIKPSNYRVFVEDNIGYQRDLARIRKLKID